MGGGAASRILCRWTTFPRVPAPETPLRVRFLARVWGPGVARGLSVEGLSVSQASAGPWRLNPERRSAPGRSAPGRCELCAPGRCEQSGEVRALGSGEVPALWGGASAPRGRPGDASVGPACCQPACFGREPLRAPACGAVT